MTQYPARHGLLHLIANRSIIRLAKNNDSNSNHFKYDNIPTIISYNTVFWFINDNGYTD